VDESGVDHRLFREYCRAPRGTGVFEAVSGKRRARTSVIGAWSEGRFLAPMVLEGPCDRHVMDAYFEGVLLPGIPPGSVVVLDNASFHHASRIRELARGRGVELLYLPAYSPDLNPIEHFWATLKKYLSRLLPTSDSPFDAICAAAAFFAGKHLNVE
jgi:transposase